jgi:hypothetical protein
MNEEMRIEAPQESIGSIGTWLKNIEPLCEIFVKSGIFADTKDIAQAIVKVMAGKEMGLSPLESMMGLYIVNGKVAAESKVISSLIKKSARYDYRIEKLDCEECSISFLKKTEQGEVVLGVSTFTIKDAAKAGIVNGSAWKAYPKNMLFARAMSNGAKWFTPDVFCGYSREEMEGISEAPATDIVSITDDGEVKRG